MNKIMILIGILIFSFVLIGVPNNSFANSYQNYYNKCKNGQGGMRLRAITGEYRTMTCKEYATYKVTHKYPPWAWTNKNKGRINGRNGDYAPVKPVRRSHQEVLDRKLNNERYRLEQRSIKFVRQYVNGYLSQISVNDPNKYMWRLHVEKNYNKVVNCINKEVSHGLLTKYNDRASDISDMFLWRIIGTHLNLLFDVCTQ